MRNERLGRPLPALQAFQYGLRLFVERHTHGARVLLPCLVRNVLHSTFHDVVGSQAHKVAVPASDKALKHEHIPVGGKCRVIRQVHAIDGVPFLQGQVVRRSVNLCRNLVAVERAVGCRPLLYRPVESRAYPAHQSAQGVSTPPFF